MKGNLCHSSFAILAIGKKLVQTSMNNDDSPIHKTQ